MLSKQVANTLDLIGSTPIVRLNKIPPADAATIWAKLEGNNPGGSVKDRPALAMVEAAERDGLLKPGGVIVEPTSGNTGGGLALVAAVKGYRVILIMPDKASMERRKVMAAFGAELILTPAQDGIKASIAKAEEILAEHPDYFMPNQFKNPANPEVHFCTTGPEIIDQVPGSIDAFVAGVGTGGTITGVAKALKAKYPDVLIVALEPTGSPVLSGGKPGKSKIQGIGPGFIPDVLDLDLIDEILLVGDDDAWNMVRRLPREEGIFAGISSGAAIWGAVQVAQRVGPGKTIVTVLPSYGERYLSTGVFDA